MEKKSISVLILFLVAFLCLSGCTKEEEAKETGYDLSGKTYYNTVDDYGNEDHSKIWFGKDGTFVMKDNFYDGYYEISGTWSIKENVATLEVSDTGVGEFKKIVFEIADEDTLVLKTSLAGSLQDHVFSTTETKGSSAPAPEFKTANYYNISQSGSNVSRLELHSDGSFTFLDQNDFGITEINGTYATGDNIVKMKGTAASTEYSFDFVIAADGTLVLQNDIGVSATGDVFSSIYEPSVKVLCTGLTSLYNNYWATEGVKNYDLGVKATPENTTDVITYYVEDENVVKVDENGLASTVNVGKTKIHITCGDQEKVVGFETKAKGPSSIEFDENPLVFYVNNTVKISAKALPATADQALTYKSSDESVATVDKYGNITGICPGSTEITVTAVNGVSAVLKVWVEGETVIFKMKNNVSVKAGSGEKIPYKATWIMCYDGSLNKIDVTDEVEFHTAYTSALDIDGHGNVYAKGAIYETTDVPVSFSYSDGSSFYVESETFYVHVVK